MTQPQDRTEPGEAADATHDVFTVARWFDGFWNSAARAVSPDRIEWQCTTWGSGRGAASWTETAPFLVVAEVFGLRQWRNYDARDELLVEVPVALFAEIADLMRRLGDVEEWAWLRGQDFDRQVAVAAVVLGLPAATLAANNDLLEALGIE